MTSSGQSSKHHLTGHFLSTHQNAVVILEEVARATHQELLASGITEPLDKVMIESLILAKS